MPEIPEIETIRRQLENTILYKEISEVEITREKTFNLPPNIINNSLQNTSITQVLRRGKILILQFTRPISLVFHFMLEGYLKWVIPSESFSDKYQLMLKFTTGECLYFCKMYLGYIHLEMTTDLEQITEIQELGPDPLATNFTYPKFHQMLLERRKMIKPLLMDQEFLAGIGNTYSNEGLFLAGILPHRKAAELQPQETEKLFNQLRQVLLKSISLGGVGDETYSTSDTLTGGFIPELKVRHRDGEPCYVCGTPIAFKKMGGRNTFYCPVCQH